MKRRTVAQMIADSELGGTDFLLQSVERCLDRKPVYTVESVVNQQYLYTESVSYLWRFQSIERRYTVYATLRTAMPDLFLFEVRYPWSELRVYKPHIHDFGQLNTKL